MPIARWSLVPRMAASMVAVMSPSAITLMRAPASRISAIRSSWRGRSSTIAVMSATRRPNASAIASRFSPTGRAQVDAAPGNRADRHLLHVHARHRGHAAGVAGGEDRQRADAAAGDHAGALDRVERQVELTAAAAHARPRRAARWPVLGRGRSPPVPVIGSSVERLPPSPRWPPRRPGGRRPGPGSARRPARERSVTETSSVHGQAGSPATCPPAASAACSSVATGSAVARRRGRGPLQDQVEHRPQGEHRGRAASTTGTPIRSARATR